ncbi:hypothetical protein ACFS5L_20115 [Streptomyces phyllanthi]|uniref:Calcium-binding protein n=1 Tax=Streptomyces phyllanthi TaxID=1803180 RepID=A0A5N8W348_9ACTN|nr:hypothetical protein [Streptomyces phyllanthi]MPY41927.1 hypothetical protein [Streptomyces phyllanthi]
MRIRATVAVVSGALALSAFAVPAAQADGSASNADIAKIAKAADSGRTTFDAAAGEPYALDATFSNVKINKGKAIAVGTTKVVKAPVTFTLTHGADVDYTAEDFFAFVELYRGASFEDADWAWDTDPAVCTAVTDTTASCTTTLELDPIALLNEDAGSWKVAAFAVAFNGENLEDPDLSKVGVAVQDPAAASVKLQRYSKLTVNASPEPVKKGKTITVTGKLTRANWDTGKYAGYTNQSVKLQYKKKGASSYSDVKTVKSGSGGALKTTVKATADGYFRYVFAGTSTTPAVKAKGDFVDVK